MKSNLKSDTTSQNKIITIPNILSFFRICLIPVLVWLYCIKKEYIWTGVILVLSGATDVIDGFIARKFHMISDLGKMLDPVADKMTQVVMLGCLFTRFPLMLIPLILMVAKESFMAVTGLLVIQKTGHVFGAYWHGKIVTCLLYAMMILHIFWYNIPENISTVIICVCLIMMLISLTLYGIANINMIKKKE